MVLGVLGSNSIWSESITGCDLRGRFVGVNWYGLFNSMVRMYHRSHVPMSYFIYMQVMDKVQARDIEVFKRYICTASDKEQRSG